jgi:hypothetical protein
MDDIYKDLSNCEQFTQFLRCKFYKCIYVMTIGVLDELRQMHIGSNLLNYIYNIALDIENCIGVYLHVICYNEIAIKFYKKNKFRKVSKVNNYYYINGKNYDSFVFLRLISKKEKEDYKNNMGNSKQIVDENKYKYKNINIIKLILLIIFIITNILIEYKKNQKI